MVECYLLNENGSILIIFVKISIKKKNVDHENICTNYSQQIIFVQIILIVMRPTLDHSQIDILMTHN